MRRQHDLEAILARVAGARDKPVGDPGAKERQQRKRFCRIGRRE
jgi:hypothetical protein